MDAGCRLWHAASRVLISRHSLLPVNYSSIYPLFFLCRSWYFPSIIMKLPHWVEEEVKMLPVEFTGRITMECYRGGVTRVETNTSRQAPKPVEPVRHALSA